MNKNDCNYVETIIINNDNYILLFPYALLNQTKPEININIIHNSYNTQKIPTWNPWSVFLIQRYDGKLSNLNYTLDEIIRAQTGYRKTHIWNLLSKWNSYLSSYTENRLDSWFPYQILHETENKFADTRNYYKSTFF